MATTTHIMVMKLALKVVVSLMRWLFREETTSFSLLHIIKNLTCHCMRRPMWLLTCQCTCSYEGITDITIIIQSFQRVFAHPPPFHVVPFISPSYKYSLSTLDSPSSKWWLANHHTAIIIRVSDYFTRSVMGCWAGCMYVFARCRSVVELVRDGFTFKLRSF
jgi:hypothetical protein